jgi:anaerobic ribonucleoside-triphosphate reductase activating protein
MKDGYIWVGAFEPRSTVNGPGVRAVLWVQGCGKRCPGCFNPEFLPREAGRLVGVDEVVGWIVAANGSPDGVLEGVTFSGGEPFDQAEPLAEVAGAARGLGLGVFVFTGYPWRELELGREPGWRELIRGCDLLVAGPYEQDRPGAHPLLASGNQELVYLTERYRGWLFGGLRKQTELRIASDGGVRLTGFPSATLITSMNTKLNH